MNELIDFLAVLAGLLGETASVPMAGVLRATLAVRRPQRAPERDRDQLRARSTLSRFLAALTEEPVKALRTLFLDDLPSRPITNEKQTGGLVDRTNNTWVVFAIDGTREAARGRALPQTDELPPSCSMVG